MTSLLKVSIITVVYNGIAHLEQTIQSIINQSYQNIEYIIIDGGSTDGTLELLQKYDEKIAYWVSEKDNGIYDAMNKGIAKATGEIVGLINADDWYETNTLELVVNAFEKQEVDVIHGSMEIISADGSSFTKKVKHDLSTLKKGMLLNHPTVFVKKSFYEKYGVFNTSYKIVADWEMIFRWWLSGAKFIGIEETLANFRMGGVSSLHLKKSLVEKHKVRQVHGVVGKYDGYYLYDRLKSVLPATVLLKISLLRQSRVG